MVLAEEEVMPLRPVWGLQAPIKECCALAKALVPEPEPVLVLVLVPKGLALPGPEIIMLFIAVDWPNPVPNMPAPCVKKKIGKNNRVYM